MCTSQVDTLDDVRLLLLERIKRGSDTEMLSVVKLCSNPYVKVISTKKNIQDNFIDSAQVFNVDKQKSEEVIDDSKVLMLRGVLLESDILEVLNFPCSCPDPVTTVVKITTEPSNIPFFDFQVVLKFDKNWEIITAHTQEGYVEFPLRPMKYLFVISRENWVAHTLSPRGLIYKSADVEHVTVRFPPRSVKKNCEIRIQVVPPNSVEYSDCPDPNADPDPDVNTDIVSMSPRLWVTHNSVLKFEKPIVVTLPLPPVSSPEKETDICLVKWTDDDDVNIADTSIRLKEGFCEFEVDGFSGYSVLRRRGKKNTMLLHSDIKLCKADINECFMLEKGLSKECQILILSDKSAVNTLWIEIVESNRVEDLLKVRFEQQQLVQITNILFPTMSVRYGRSITIYALGSIRLHRNYQADSLQIKFTEKTGNNHLRFQVELIDEKSSAMLKLRLRKKNVYFCHFEANEWLRQKTETLQTSTEAESQKNPLLTANKTLHIASIQALARQIPVLQTEELATELNLSCNEVADLKAHNYKGIQLTFQVLCKWRLNSNKEPSDMIKELTKALNTLSLKNISSKLVIASTERRSLVNEDFEK
ncbi:hypothetical protein ACJMK2_018134 [Sinanodonta woodiana]|uniref:Death domain-containing protein n=1 Tax=Sinanodonta woodiana TaxID=1069815 RepID=A0ABD3UE05_SINWO